MFTFTWLVHLAPPAQILATASHRNMGQSAGTGENVFITKHVAPVPRPVACAKGLHAHTLPLDYDIEDSDG